MESDAIECLSGVPGMRKRRLDLEDWKSNAGVTGSGSTKKARGNQLEESGCRVPAIRDRSGFSRKVSITLCNEFEQIWF